VGLAGCRRGDAKLCSPHRDASQAEERQDLDDAPTKIEPPADLGELGVKVVREVLAFTEDEDGKSPHVRRIARSGNLRLAAVTVGVDRPPEAKKNGDMDPKREDAGDHAEQLEASRPRSSQHGRSAKCEYEGIDNPCKDRAEDGPVVDRAVEGIERSVRRQFVGPVVDVGALGLGMEDGGHVPSDSAEAVDALTLGDDDWGMGVVTDLVDPHVGVEVVLAMHKAPLPMAHEHGDPRGKAPKLIEGTGHDDRVMGQAAMQEDGDRDARQACADEASQDRQPEKLKRRHRSTTASCVLHRLAPYMRRQSSGEGPAEGGVQAQAPIILEGEEACASSHRLVARVSSCWAASSPGAGGHRERHVGRGRASEEVIDDRWLDRLGEEESLSDLDPLATEPAQLLGPFDPLGDGLKAKGT
jgi:hypothetical protein